MWDALHEQCPWATIFQSSGFVLSWYAAYRGAREPLIVTGTSDTGDLVGLLALAVAENDRLEVAGAQHAEYQVWLARAGAGDAFMTAACAALSQRVHRGTLRFLFLPPDAPLGWTGAPGVRNRVEVHGNERGVMLLGDGSAVAASLRKKSNRTRLQRLKREGSVTFEQLLTLEQLDTVLDEIITFCDLRQGAVHGVLPFRADPHKRELYRRMMQVPGLLHVTVLRVGDALAAAHVGMRDADRVVLGLLVHSPFFAAHSPGKLHLLLLGQLLASQGFSALDLTPGGTYKERFATSSEAVRVLTLFFRRRDLVRYRAQRAAIGSGVRLLRAAHLDPADVQRRGLAWRERLRSVRAADVPVKLLRRARRAIADHSESRIYIMPAERAAALSDIKVLRKNDLDALLAYRGSDGAAPTLEAFLREALNRLEQGQHVFTIVEDGLLVHYGWVAERQERARLAVVDQDLLLPADTSVVFDAFTHPSARGRGVYRAGFSHLIREAAAVPETRYVCACVLAQVAASRHLLDEFGFVYQGSFYKSRRLGRSRVWAEMPTAWPGVVRGIGQEETTNDATTNDATTNDAATGRRSN